MASVEAGAWKTAGQMVMCILEGVPLWGESRAGTPDAHETVLDPTSCVGPAGAVALRLAGLGSSFKAHASSRRSQARILLALGQGERQVDEIVKLRESVAEKRLRENWSGVVAVAHLLMTEPNPPSRRIRQVFSDASRS